MPRWTPSENSMASSGANRALIRGCSPSASATARPKRRRTAVIRFQMPGGGFDVRGLGRRTFLATVAEQCDRLPHRRGSSFLKEDLRQDTVGLGLELHVGLVRLDLREDLADR